jgi:hypothetical protein
VKTAKKLFLHGSDESHAKQFELLPSYVDTTKAANPNTHIHLSLDDRNGTRCYERIFIVPSASTRSFGHCRRFVAVAATYIREVFKLALTLTGALNAGYHGVVLPWAVTEGESESSWRWVFSHLHHACPVLNNEHTTLMGDRDKGLKKVDTTIPLAQHVFCAKHLSRNINTLFSRGSREAFNTYVFPESNYGGIIFRMDAEIGSRQDTGGKLRRWNGRQINMGSAISQRT